MKRTRPALSVGLALAWAGVEALNASAQATAPVVESGPGRMSAADTALMAQEFDDRPVKVYAGLGLVSAIPAGELADVIGTGWGIGVNLGWLYGDGTWSLRLDLAFAEYGSESRRVCLSPTVGCRVEVDLETANWIGYGSLGPQLAVSRGTFRPYVSPALGLVVFSTDSSVDGTGADSSPLFNTTNFSDTKVSFTLLTGVTISLVEGGTPVELDIGARYHRHGEAEYLTEDDIVDEPDGGITITPHRSDANFFTLTLGVSFGFRLNN